MDTQLTFAKPDPEGVRLLSRELGLHPVISGLLWDRGQTTPEAARFYLNPDFSDLTDPFLMKDMGRAVERIHAAVIDKEKILIFGDFDADGVTATTMLVDFLNLVEADVTWYIPHRIKEGYSIQAQHIAMAADMGVDLIITVDCGIGGIEAVTEARAEDMDVIITDHHEPGSELPDALAIVDPKQGDCQADLSFLAGVGVAFYLIMALRKYFRDQGVWEEIPEPSLVDFLDLFTIGTIGDMVPLIRENRVLCMAGIRQIQKGNRPGIRALAAAARIDLRQLDSDDISFKIVPRINAAGRISHARICVSLLTSDSLADAEKTAGLMDDLNQRRQLVEKDIVADIETRILKDPSLLDDRFLLLWDESWNPSVLGIAASKLSKKYVLPVILLSTDNDVAMGSCRSINQINIHQALTESAHLLTKFGGHAMASGLTLSKDKLPDLADGLKHYFARHYSEADFRKSLTIDAELGIGDIDMDLARDIDRLRPFGTANPEPVFLARDLQVASSHIIGRFHRKMMLTAANAGTGPAVEALHFNVPDLDNLPNYYTSLAFRLKLNKFRAAGTPQMIIEAV